MTNPADDDMYRAVVSIADEPLAAMQAILAGVSGEQANRAPALPATNSPYSIGVHCVGMADYSGVH